jgi:hypothetical protein
MRKEPTVRTRQMLASVFNERLDKTHKDLLQLGRYQYDTNLVKTYLIEAHLRGSRPSEFLRDLFPGALGRKKALHYEVEESEEEDLTIIRASEGAREANLYVDTSDPRFWRVHSMSYTEIVDTILSALVRRSTRVDHAWLPISELQRIAKEGVLQGMGLEYEQRVHDRLDHQRRRFRLQSIATDATEVVEALRRDDHLAGTIALSKVRVRHYSEDGNSFCYDNVAYDGRTTVRGNSFEVHLAFINSLYNRYSETVRGFESNVAIASEADRLSGIPVTIRFPFQLEDLDRFCKTLFTASPPFRFVGTAAEVTPKMYKASVVDQHVGSTVQAEVTRGFLRFYLPAGGCGNSILRLFTNLQHHFDARVELLNPITGEVL